MDSSHAFVRVVKTSAWIDCRDLASRRVHVRLELALTALALDRPPLLQLDGVGFVGLSVTAAGLPVPYTYSGTVLRVECCGLERVEMAYSVVDPPAGLVFPSGSSQTVATDFEASSARYVFFCHDRAAEACSWALHVRAATSLRRLGSGRLVGEEHHADGSTTTSWLQERPVPAYVVAFVVGPFRCIDGTLFASDELDDATVRRTFAATPSILEWMAVLFGPLPSEKYWQVLVEVSSAMENESLVTYPPSTYALRSELEASEFGPAVMRTLCHEALHMHFGNKTRILDHSHLWVKESLATFLPMLWAGAEDPEMAEWYYCRDLVVQWRQGGVRPALQRPERHADELFTADSYACASLRMANLMALLGEQTFFSGLCAVLERDSMDTFSFMRAMERVSGRDLAWWFDQWILQTGAPVLTLSVEDDQLTVHMEGAFSFDLDVCGDVQRFSPTRRSVTVRLREDGAIDLNSQQRVPCSISVRESRVPRSVLLASLGSPSVGAFAKAALFQLLDDPETSRSVLVLERRWGVRWAYVSLGPAAVAAHALEHDRSGPVRAAAVSACRDPALALARFDALSLRSQDVALRSCIADVPFLKRHALAGRSAACLGLARAGAAAVLAELPDDTPGLLPALAACKGKEAAAAKSRAIALLPSDRSLTNDERIAALQLLDVERLKELYAKGHISESVFELDVAPRTLPSPVRASKTHRRWSCNWITATAAVAVLAAGCAAAYALRRKCHD